MLTAATTSAGSSATNTTTDPLEIDPSLCSADEQTIYLALFVTALVLAVGIGCIGLGVLHVAERSVFETDHDDVLFVS